VFETILLAQWNCYKFATGVAEQQLRVQICAAPSKARNAVFATFGLDMHGGRCLTDRLAGPAIERVG
jgi:hypothetical protein